MEDNMENEERERNRFIIQYTNEYLGYDNSDIAKIVFRIGIDTFYRLVKLEIRRDEFVEIEDIPELMKKIDRKIEILKALGYSDMETDILISKEMEKQRNFIIENKMLRSEIGSKLSGELAERVCLQYVKEDR
jgi:hypothetical protein